VTYISKSAPSRAPGRAQHLHPTDIPPSSSALRVDETSRRELLYRIRQAATGHDDTSGDFVMKHERPMSEYMISLIEALKLHPRWVRSVQALYFDNSACLLRKQESLSTWWLGRSFGWNSCRIRIRFWRDLTERSSHLARYTTGWIPL